LDENIRLSSELHRSFAERLYELKLILKKPDVSDIKTPDEREGKVKEFADRSVDSLKDQIQDLLIEKEQSDKSNVLPEGVDNPGAGQNDKTNTVKDDDQKAESKPEKIKKLFG
jgi:hypothetical protein